jgi:hypothetical protein
LAGQDFHQGRPSAARHLDQVFGTFVDGYHAALDDGRPEKLGPRLSAVSPEFRGFAFEGAGLCLAAFDMLTPWKRNRWLNFLNGPGESQSYMMHVGYGIALAHFGRRADEGLGRLAHPGERWLSVDGYGFHSGCLKWRYYVKAHAAPPGLTGFAGQVFDHGLGRALWFGCGADVEHIQQTISAFPPDRRSDLWSGVGVACTFAGGVEEEDLRALCQATGEYQPYLKLGAALAATLRHRAGDIVPYTELACQIVCELSATQAAGLFAAALNDLPDDGPEPVYAVIRRRIFDQLTAGIELAK